MATWQLQEAKQKLSEVVNRAMTEGAQTITRHGVETAVVLSIDEFRRLQQAPPKSLKQVLLESVGLDDGYPELADVLPERGRWRKKPPAEVFE
jgi:antitoxin Phd